MAEQHTERVHPIVPKTLKLFINGAFVRSESGATATSVPSIGQSAPAAQVPDASRKDARDAVRAAGAAQPAWGARDAYNRAQVLYRVAEMIASRFDLAGTDQARAASARWVYWAGWADKLHHVLGAVNQPSGPYESTSTPVPQQVTATIAAPNTTLADLADLLAPTLCAGGSIVAVLDPSDTHLLASAEALAVSDLPAGVVNLLTTTRSEVAATLAAHSHVTALDVSQVPDRATELATLAAENLTRVRYPHARTDALSRLRDVTEVRTTWHPATV